MVAQRRTFLQYIWVKHEAVYFSIFVCWHKGVYFCSIFGLNMKIFISLSLCAGTNTYIFVIYLGEICRCLFNYLYVVAVRRKFLQYIWVKYKDVYFSIFVLFYKDVHIKNIFGLYMKLFIPIYLCGGTMAYIFAVIFGLYMKNFILSSLCGGTKT